MRDENELAAKYAEQEAHPRVLALVWGNGVAASTLVQRGISDRRGHAQYPDFEWCVLVECDEEELDALTRFDPAVELYRVLGPVE